MKKYMTPELSELFMLEDILVNSDDDNIFEDPFEDGTHDAEDELFELIAD